MSFVPQLAHLATSVPAYLVTASALLLTCTATLLVGLVRRGRGFIRRIPGIVFIGAGSAAFWTLPFERTRPWTVIAVATAATALLIEMVLAYREPVDTRDLDLGSARMARRYLVATLLVVAGLLLYHLGNYSGALLTWEAPVVAGYPYGGGFAEAYNQQGRACSHTARSASCGMKGCCARVTVLDNDPNAAGENPPVAGAEVELLSERQQRLATVVTNELGIAGFATPPDVPPEKIVVCVHHPDFNPRHLRLDGTNLAIDLREELYGR